MLVAASTECFADLPFTEAVSKFVDLEYTSVEISLSINGQIQLGQLVDDFENVTMLCRDTHRLNIVGYNVLMEPDEPGYYEKFASVCKLAKATKVVQITIPSGELGTPFNEEVERLRRLVDLATLEGARVSIKSQVGRLSEDPDTVVVLCDNVKSLGVTLDPSHYICGPHGGRSIDKLMKYTYHVQLRDTSKKEMQVRVGQGEIEYGRLISQLRKCRFDRALAVHITEIPDVDHTAEMRKMRLLLESLL